jgi:HEAT repeat protein
VALDALEYKPGDSHLIDDTPYNQAMRVRSMAAQALGDIGEAEALPALQGRLEAQDDPRVQVAAAKAILQVLGRRSPWDEERGPNRTVQGGR